MGPTSFKGDQVTKQDIGVAKNYLSEEELKKLNSLVSGYFDIAEFRAQQHIPTRMADYVKQLDNILSFAGVSTLKDAGCVSRKQALAKAEKEYRVYQKKTLAPVEADYLEAIKSIEKQAIKNNKQEGNDN